MGLAFIGCLYCHYWKIGRKSGEWWLWEGWHVWVHVPGHPGHQLQEGNTCLRRWRLCTRCAELLVCMVWCSEWIACAAFWQEVREHLGLTVRLQNSFFPEAIKLLNTQWLGWYTQIRTHACLHTCHYQPLICTISYTHTRTPSYISYILHIAQSFAHSIALLGLHRLVSVSFCFFLVLHCFCFVLLQFCALRFMQSGDWQ